MERSSRDTTSESNLGRAAPGPTERTIAEQLARGLVLVGTLGLAITLLWTFLIRRIDGPTSVGSVESPGSAVEVSGPAPDFELPLLGDEDSTMSLSSLRGHVVVLNFWGSWCLPCRDEAPSLQESSERYASEGVRFVGVNVLDDEAAALAFQGEFDITYPSVFDPAGSLADDYGYFGLPATYVIDDRGTMRYQFVGYVTGPAIRAAVRSVLD
ncbi:MAG: TlpA disulfide reductase family protein [Actinomycetota bacterium]